MTQRYGDSVVYLSHLFDPFIDMDMHCLAYLRHRYGNPVVPPAGGEGNKVVWKMINLPTAHSGRGRQSLLQTAWGCGTPWIRCQSVGAHMHSLTVSAISRYQLAWLHAVGGQDETGVPGGTPQQRGCANATHRQKGWDSNPCPRKWEATTPPYGKTTDEKLVYNYKYMCDVDIFWTNRSIAK